MKLSGLNPRRFWSAESGMTGLLLFLVVYLFVVCALHDFSFGDLVADLLFSVIILAGVLTAFRQRWVRPSAIPWQWPLWPSPGAEHFQPEGSLILLNIVLKLIFLGFLLAVLIVQVLGRDR